MLRIINFQVSGYPDYVACTYRMPILSDAKPLTCRYYRSAMTELLLLVQLAVANF